MKWLRVELKVEVQGDLTEDEMDELASQIELAVDDVDGVLNCHYITDEEIKD